MTVELPKNMEYHNCLKDPDYKYESDDYGKTWQLSKTEDINRFAIFCSQCGKKLEHDMDNKGWIEGFYIGSGT